MWGTIARFQVTPGKEAFVRGQMQAMSRARLTGWQHISLFESADHPHELWMLALFDTEEHYKANAASPTQHAAYLTLRSACEADPEWHDVNELLTVRAADQPAP